MSHCAAVSSDARETEYASRNCACRVRPVLRGMGEVMAVVFVGAYDVRAELSHLRGL